MHPPDTFTFRKVIMWLRNLKEMVTEGVEWLHMAQSMGWWWAKGKVLIKFSILQKKKILNWMKD